MWYEEFDEEELEKDLKRAERWLKEKEEYNRKLDEEWGGFFE